MGRHYDSWYPPYVPVAERRRNAEKAAAKLGKKGQTLSPVRLDGPKIAASYWGKAWCKHLESFSDYANRLPRGRSYLRHGAVLDLKIGNAEVTGLVQGTATYKVSIAIATLAAAKWKAIRQRCAGEIGSVIELLQGRLSAAVMATVADKEQGLFPLPREIKLKCSCPDDATMCKHVAAVLYGIGARLDRQPELLFVLRNVDHLELISSAALPAGAAGQSGGLEGQDLSALFGIDVEEAPAAKARKKPAKKAAARGKRLAS